MSRTTVRSFWYGGALSPLERMCIRSFLAHGHGFEVYSYNPDLDVPAGCVLRPAAEIFPESAVVTYQRNPGKGHVALFANWFRYKLLLERGGWWVDLDMVCLTDDLPDADHAVGYEDDEGSINNAAIKAPAGSPLMRYCLDRALEIGTDATWGQSGPRLLTEAVDRLGMGDCVLPRAAFYPHAWHEALLALQPGHTAELLLRTRGSLMVHLWTSVLRNHQVGRHRAPPPGSLIDLFLQRFPEEAPQAGPARPADARRPLRAAFAIDAPLPRRLANAAIAALRPDLTARTIQSIGRAPDYVRPAGFTDKMQCRKLFDRNPNLPVFCDKLAVRAYADSSGCGVRLPELYWAGPTPELIPYDRLPVPCVVKPNCRSGAKFVVRSREDASPWHINRVGREWLATAYGTDKHEWGYARVPRRILVEELLPAPEGQPFPDQYNIYVFSGRVGQVQFLRPMPGGETAIEIFDPDWRRLDARKWMGWYGDGGRNRPRAGDVPRPPNYGRMIEIAEHLGRNMDHVRVDLYNIDGEIYLGELTAYADSGWAYAFPASADFTPYPPRDMDRALGALWQQEQPPVAAKLWRLLTRR